MYKIAKTQDVTFEQNPQNADLAWCHPIPFLPILDEIINIAKQQELPTLSNVAFIGAQHKLETTATLFQSLIKLGAKPENMFFTGKCYSTCVSVENTMKTLRVNIFDDPIPRAPGGYAEACKKVIKKMWKKFDEHLANHEDIKKIIILDDGARVVEELKFLTIINYQVIVIEQTRGGLYSQGLIDHGIFPMISVAQSATKKIIEAPLIATAILTRLQQVVADLKINQATCGVVGNGAVGKMVANYLASLGHAVKVYDQVITIKNHENIRMVSNIEEIFKGSSFVFGCTGRDITEGLDLAPIIDNDQIWISGSSEDREFKSFMLLHAKNLNGVEKFDPMADVLFKLPSGNTITIKQGGFPFNFDRKPWNVPASDIEITQGCLLGAVIQAAIIDEDRTKYKLQPQQQLNPYIQSFIVARWGDREQKSGINRFDKDTIDMFKVPAFIEEKSGRANCVDSLILQRAFQIDFNLNELPVDRYLLDMHKFMHKALLFINQEKAQALDEGTSFDVQQNFGLDYIKQPTTSLNYTI